MNDWKVAFALESNHVADEMRCFATKSTWEEDVLGMPVVYTVNPKTKRVDYLSCEPELVSRTAVYEDKVRFLLQSLTPNIGTAANNASFSSSA